MAHGPDTDRRADRRPADADIRRQSAPTAQTVADCDSAKTAADIDVGDGDADTDALGQSPACQSPGPEPEPGTALQQSCGC
eukprot:8681797-Alexandrium_andersonii.AAC.1